MDRSHLRDCEKGERRRRSYDDRCDPLEPPRLSSSSSSSHSHSYSHSHSHTHVHATCDHNEREFDPGFLSPHVHTGDKPADPSIVPDLVAILCTREKIAQLYPPKTDVDDQALECPSCGHRKCIHHFWMRNIKKKKQHGRKETVGVVRMWVKGTPEKDCILLQWELNHTHYVSECEFFLEALDPLSHSIVASKGFPVDGCLMRRRVRSLDAEAIEDSGMKGITQASVSVDALFGIVSSRGKMLGLSIPTVYFRVTTLHFNRVAYSEWFEFSREIELSDGEERVLKICQLSMPAAKSHK
eukprot:TRINITY_DN11629_c0_g1_i1.p1 TRINITY_DN11629_c0_g1~~TRINITY_DN11629_c0_g1_i1.p1  ORF type:complete len:298 (-),score=66.33 TRINITY_DN11629_c0_g1_i1:19-912(-)